MALQGFCPVRIMVLKSNFSLKKRKLIFVTLKLNPIFAFQIGQYIPISSIKGY